MDDYVAKPIQLAPLAAKLDQWLALSGAKPPPSAPAVAPIDVSVLAEISSGDPVVARDILERFRLYNAEDASLLMDAVENEDLREVNHASHRIKGASKTIGAMSLAAVCERLERASRANDWPTVAAYIKDFSRELARVNAYVGSL
jgi:HPt (histidine-containing phosphotransfer) domain-containing protein